MEKMEKLDWKKTPALEQETLSDGEAKRLRYIEKFGCEPLSEEEFEKEMEKERRKAWLADPFGLEPMTPYYGRPESEVPEGVREQQKEFDRREQERMDQMEREYEEGLREYFGEQEKVEAEKAEQESKPIHNPRNDNNEFGVPEFDGGSGEIEWSDPDLEFALTHIKKTYEYGRLNDVELYALSEPTPNHGWRFIVMYNTTMQRFGHKTWKSADSQAKNLRNRSNTLNWMLGG
jgi:hypothetical protein